jgi:hypothetical protein
MILMLAGLFDFSYHYTSLFSSHRVLKISDHRQSWGNEDGPWKRPEPPLLEATDF